MNADHFPYNLRSRRKTRQNTEMISVETLAQRTSYSNDKYQLLKHDDFDEDSEDEEVLTQNGKIGKNDEKRENSDSDDFNDDTVRLIGVNGHVFSSHFPDSGESLCSITMQILFPFIVAGLGMVGAGLVLDVVQHWQVFEVVNEIFILVPALLGLKGNLEMTLASRLSTQVRNY